LIGLILKGIFLGCGFRPLALRLSGQLLLGLVRIYQVSALVPQYEFVLFLFFSFLSTFDFPLIHFWSFQILLCLCC